MRPDDILALKMMKQMQLAHTVIPSTLPSPITKEFKTFNLMLLSQSSQYVAEDRGEFPHFIHTEAIKDKPSFS